MLHGTPVSVLQLNKTLSRHTFRTKHTRVKVQQHSLVLWPRFDINRPITSLTTMNLLHTPVTMDEDIETTR